MAAGISINVGADTRAFASGVDKGIVTPLEDVQDTFKRVESAGDKAGDQLTDSFKGAQAATVEYGRDYQRMSDQIQQSSRSTSRKITVDSQDFTRKSTKGFDEVGESARSNAIELGSSFTGGFDQAAGGLQGFMAEFLAGFGPAGIIAGVAAAAGIGLITQQVTEGTEAAEAQKQAVADLSSEYIAAGKSGRRSFDSVKTAIEAMATSTDGSDVIITLQKAWELAGKAGGDYQDVVAAIASGSPAEIDAARRKLGQLTVEHQNAERAARSYGGSAAQAAATTALAAEQLDSKLAEAGRQAKEAGRAQELAAKAGLSDLQLKTDLIGQLEDAYDEAAGSTEFFNKKTGEFDPTGYIKNVRKIRAELMKYNDDLAKSDLSAESKKFLESQGAESAAAMLAGYRKASPAQKAELNEIWSTAGSESASNYQDAIGKKLDSKLIKAPSIEEPVVPLANTRAIDAQLAQPRYMKVYVDAYLRNGQRVP